MGNQNAITYKEIFKLIKENKMWLGQSLNGKNILFQIPDHYESYYKIIDELNRYTVLDVAGLNDNAVKNHLHMTEIGGKSTYFRVLIKNKKII